MATEAAPGNGVSGDVTNGVSSSFEADKAAFMAGLIDEEPTDAPKADAPDKGDDDSDLAEDEEAAIETAEDDASDESAPEDDAEDDDSDLDEDEDEETDSEAAKRIAKVKRTDQRLRERREAEWKEREAQFAREREKYEAQLSELQAFEQLKARVKYDPGAALRAMGVSVEDFELIAQSIYAESPALASDPKQKAVALAKLREREKEDKLTATERRLAELEAKLEQQQVQARVQAEASRYIAELNTAATKAPLVAHMLKADGESTHDALVQTYGVLEKKLGRQPKPSEVVAAYDKRERARLQKLGIDPNTIAKAAPKPAAKPAAPATGKAKPAAATKTEDRPLTKDDFLKATYD